MFSLASPPDANLTSKGRFCDPHHIRSTSPALVSRPWNGPVNEISGGKAIRCYFWP